MNQKTELSEAVAEYKGIFASVPPAPIGDAATPAAALAKNRSSRRYPTQPIQPRSQPIISMSFSKSATSRPLSAPWTPTNAGILNVLLSTTTHNTKAHTVYLPISVMTPAMSNCIQLSAICPPDRARDEAPPRKAGRGEKLINDVNSILTESLDGFCRRRSSLN
jgi:hypothetical protein